MENNTKYGLHGKLVAQKGNRKELSEILLAAAELMKTAEGCHLYLVSIDENEETDEVWVTEIWDSKEHHQNSLKVPGVRDLIGKAMPLLNGSPQKGQRLEVLGGLGI